MTRRTRGLALAVAVLLLATGLTVLAPSTLAASGPSAPGSAGAPSLANPATAAPFSARAGYSSTYVAEVTGTTAASGPVEVVVTFESPNPTLYTAPAAGSTPLTPAEFTNAYGLSAAAYAQMEAYFVGQGLTVTHVWASRLALSLAGPAARVAAAFGTQLRTGTWSGAPVLFPSEPPTLPSTLEPEVSAVVGLSSGFTPFTLPFAPALGTAASSSPISPSVARDIYDVSGLYNLTSTPTYATHESLAVVLWGNNGYAPSDVATFYSELYPSSFPAPTIVPYPLDGANPPSSAALSDPDQTAVQELTLDLEWSGSMAPGATLEPVYVPEGPAPSYSPSSADMTDALSKAIALDPAAISMSFGTAESTDQSLASAWGTLLAQAAQEGISVLAATGDLGGDAEASCQGGPAPEYPSTSPEVIAVGGTNVALQQNVLGQITGFSESAWSGSGGGFSTQFSAPSWQTSNVPAIAQDGQRGEPDVSATAALNWMYYDGEETPAAGTSFATPLWAGLVTQLTALHGSSLGFLPPRLYAIGAEEPTGKIGVGLADITTGSNCVASAGTGWDAATGWGTPRGVTLYEEMTATFVNLSIAARPAATAPAGQVTISAHLANASTDAPIVGVPVEITLTSDVDLGPCAGTFGSAAPVTGPDGNVSATIAVPWCYLGAHAIAGVSVTTNGYYGINSTSVGVDLLVFVPFLAGIATYPLNVVAYAVLMAGTILIGVGISTRFPRTPLPPRPRPVRRRARGAPPAPPPAGASPPPAIAPSSVAPPPPPPPGAAGPGPGP